MTVRQFVEHVNAREEAFDFRTPPVAAGWRVKHLRVVGHPRTRAGRFEFVGAVTDITERKRAESDLQHALDEIKKLRDLLYKENIALREEVDKASMFEEIVGDSPALQAVLARVAKVAPTDSTVLITGETGTGKELIARAIHKRSRRASRAFVSVIMMMIDQLDQPDFDAFVKSNHFNIFFFFFFLWMMICHIVTHSSSLAFIIVV